MNFLIGCVCITPNCYSNNGDTNAPKKPNILFICVDDLRCELGAYGSIAQTPNLDKLAKKGSLFFNHYVQVPTSGASRGSMLTGKLPSKRVDVGNSACEANIAFRKDKNGPESFFQQLKDHAYYTVGIGKISHSPDGYIYGYTEKKSSQLEMPNSWNEMLLDAGKWGTGWNAFFAYSNGENRQSLNKQVKPYECANVNDDGLPDGLTAQLAVEKLKVLSKKENPFCLAIGFFKPHLPFNAPQKYWDLYDENKIPLSSQKEIAIGVSPTSLHSSGEFNGYQKGDEKASLKHSLSDDYARKIKHAYLACVSYTDAQIGKVLAALEKTGEADNTIVVIWGDHGWHLGDQQVWGKHTLMETALNSTLIVVAPDIKKGVENKRIVSSIDIYPTLMDLCNIPKPAGLDGVSFAKLLKQPQHSDWNDIAYGYFSNGITMRTPEYRYTKYFRKQQPNEEFFIYNVDESKIENTIKRLSPNKLKDVQKEWNKGNTGIYEKTN